jgi:hypothetical protein
MKRAIIVHCWDGYPEYCWYPSVKKELESKGFEVQIPAFPDTSAPNLKKWLPVLKKVIGTPDEETYLIGHSVGCIAILRYLESLTERQKVGGVVLVAGFTDDLNGVDEITDELSNFFETPIDSENIKAKARSFVAIHSDNDPFVDMRYAHDFQDKLGAQVIVKHAKGHFSGEVDNEDSCTELPDVTKSILNMV